MHQMTCDVVGDVDVANNSNMKYAQKRVVAQRKSSTSSGLYEPSSGLPGCFRESSTKSCGVY